MHTWTVLLVSHVAAASVGVLLGGYQLWRRPRGDARHRLLGRVWCWLMAWTALSSFWIREIADGAFSWLHVLSVVTLVSIVLGVLRARSGDIPGHRGAMMGAWIGSATAFVFAVAIPDRHIPAFAMGNPLGAAQFTAAVVGATILCIAIGTWLTPRRREHRLPG
ncbi:MAG: DUF2306 domain-containing protein [Actinomycetia bacterium]|nr:DUF2306 domain-containing protein [Actinomycetes bacterium]